MHITYSDITGGLRELGLNTGYQVLVHSSLSSMGYVEGGADTVIDALLEVVGDSGTVLMPTLTGSKHLSVQNPPVFDPIHTPGWTGKIPETFRRRAEAVRSLHPTHSVAAIGADATALTQQHIDSISPCDEYSPYGKLSQMSDGYILLIGVEHISNTTFHHVEETIGVDYHLQKGLVKSRIMVNGQEITRHNLLHAYGIDRNFDVMDSVFVERGVQRTGKIGGTVARLVHSGGMVSLTQKALLGDQTILCIR